MTRKRPASRKLRTIQSQRACFAYENADVCVTVYSKRKDRMKFYEVNAHLDLAKADLIDQMRQP